MIVRTLTLLASAAPLAVLVTAAACSSTAADPYPDASSFCDAFATAECNNLAAQCVTTADVCHTNAKTTCITNGQAAGRPYQSSHAQDCLDKTNALYAAKTISATDAAAQAESCGRVFSGNAQKNAACAVDFDCTGDLICDKKVCATKVTKNAGDQCNNAGEVCPDGTYCGDPANTGLRSCVADAASGAACSASLPCVSTLRCTLATPPATCQPKVNIGAPCTTDSDCPTTTTPPYCDPVSSKCTPLFTAGTKSCKDLGGS